MEARLTVFRGGNVFDGQQHHPRTDVLVAAGVVVAVGPELDAPVGTHEVDVAGGLLSPGFVDAHVHAVQGGLERIRCDLSGGATREDYLTTIGEYAAANTGSRWIQGGGWAMAAFPGGTPTAADLDEVVPDRPVFLPNRDHHGAWVNSKAMELAGLTRDTPDPADGRIERDPDGHPTGTLHEGAMHLVGDQLPRTSLAELDRAFVTAQEYLLSLGVTAWQDAILGDYAGGDDPSETYRRAAISGRLKATVTGALWWERSRGLEQIADLRAKRGWLDAGRLTAPVVKIMLDGVVENLTASLSTPYVGTENAGLSHLSREELFAAVAGLTEEGFSVHVHTIGDQAVRDALDAIEASPRGGLRHHLAHLQVVHPHDVPRFALLGVGANMQMLWACNDDQMTELTLPVLGPQRSAWQYPFGDLARSGALLGAGSDWPVSTPDPLAAIHVGVNRVALGEDAPPLLPEQSLSLEQAFAAYTSGSARLNHDERQGRIVVGSTADLVVLDRDPFLGPPEEIGGTRVRGTWIDGEQVYAAP